MDENTMINLFDKAIEKRELLKLAIGQDEYFIPDRESGGHWIYAIWRNHIQMSPKGEAEKERNVCNMITQLIESDVDIENKGELLLYHYHTFYYLFKEGKFTSDYLKSLQIDSATVFKQFLDSQESIEKRNLIISALERIKNNGGADFLPDEGLF